MTRQSKAARAAQVQRLQAMAGVVEATLGAVLVARADEQAGLLRSCAVTADRIAGELAELSGGES